MDLVVAIGIVLLGAAAFAVSLIPKRFERPYVHAIGVLTIVLGVSNAVLQYRGAAQLKEEIEGLGTPVDWSESEAAVGLIDGGGKTNGVYQLVVKVIPSNHDGIDKKNFSLFDGHAFNEPNYLNEEDAKRLFNLTEKNGFVDLRKEYESGIFTYSYAGSYNEVTKRVEFKPDSRNVWPNPYPSLRALEGKYVVSMLAAGDGATPIFDFLRLSLKARQGPQLLLFGVPVVEKSADGQPTLVKRNVRYVGGMFREGKFFKG